jgi:hypothetical protein
VVRDYEAGDRGAEPLRFGAAAVDSGRKVFRIATFTGEWSINATKTVTFKYQTATPNTAVAVNLFALVPAPSGTADCAIARDGTAWHLIEWFQPTTTAVVTVLTGVTLTTAGLQFTRASITVQSSATLTITTIGTTAC